MIWHPTRWPALGRHLTNGNSPEARTGQCPAILDVLALLNLCMIPDNLSLEKPTDIRGFGRP